MGGTGHGCSNQNRVGRWSLACLGRAGAARVLKPPRIGSAVRRYYGGVRGDTSSDLDEDIGNGALGDGSVLCAVWDLYRLGTQKKGRVGLIARATVDS